jgi:hypothetical protein
MSGDPQTQGDAARQSFLMAEFGKLREEIIFTIQGIVECEKYAMFVTGVMWAYLANSIATASTSRHKGLHIAAACVPFFLSALLKIKRDFLEGHTAKLGRYIWKIEDELIGPEAVIRKGLGWEHTLPAGNLHSWVRYFWAVILFGNLILAIWFILVTTQVL